VKGVARPTPAQASGGAAEERAARFLAERGLAIVARNYRTRRGEIDLVARDGTTLVFVEVRMRAGASFGGALASIDARKQARIAAAARHFLMRCGSGDVPCRFDVVTLDGDKPAWLRGAFDAAY
jgi:putative endonuclease